MNKSFQRQTCAIPFAQEGDEVCIGLVTPYRGKNWSLPKQSVAKDRCPVDAASSEALRAGGYVGLVDEEPLVTQEMPKGGVISYHPMEITGLMENWEGRRQHRRKLVPLSRLEKYVGDRNILRIIRILVGDRLGMELVS